MARKSEILKYPDELLAFINLCLDDPKLTYEATVELVNERIRDEYLDENEVSLSALGRYAKKRREKWEQAQQQMAQQKALRKEFFERFGDDGLDNAGRYAAEMLYSFMMQLQSVLITVQSFFDEGQVDIGLLSELSKVIQRLSASIGNLEKSLSENKARVDAIKREAKAEALRQASESVEANLNKAGATAKTIETIKAELLNL